MKPSGDHRWAWIKALTLLLLLLFAPLFLGATSLAGLAQLWKWLLMLLLYVVIMSLFLGALLGVNLPVLRWLERHLRNWVARFDPDAEGLWLHWARRAHHPDQGRWYVDRAAALGGREAQFQEGLVFLEGGMGAGGQGAGVDRMRRAALRGHPEAAFCLAEALRTGYGSVLPEPAEAELWYQRSAGLGFGMAAAWLARAYEDGDGVAVDGDKARHWAARAESLRPHAGLSHSLLRHDAGPPDPLVRLLGGALDRAEAAADQVVAYRTGRWALFLGAGGLLATALLLVGSIFWAGSSRLFHLPLFFASPLLLILGWQAYQLQKDRPRTGRDRLLEDAEAGDPEACFQIGLSHRQGDRHRMKDPLTATLWFRRAAEAGHRGAMEALAEAYLGGHGVLRDPREAARWAEAARHESTF
jgi:hypothetical protein